MSRASEVGQWTIGGWVGKVGGCTRRRPEKFKYMRKNSIVKLNVQRSSK